jgi:ribosomal protein S18 acetylase RimI-like enzyme
MIRPMTGEDLPQVLAIEQAVFGATAWSGRAWSGELAPGHPDRHFIVLVEESADPVEPHRIAGYGGVLRAGSDAEILTLAVSPEVQGHGHGRTLLASLLDTARSWGSISVFLEVAEHNEAAVALYLSDGFTVLGQRRHYYGPDRHALTMQLRMREPWGARLLHDEGVR